MNHTQILQLLRSGIWTDLGLFFVDIETEEERPELPFVSRKFTSPYIHQPVSVTRTGDGDAMTSKQSSQPKMTLSLTVYAESRDEALALCMKVKEWFTFVGEEYLASQDIVVVRAENVQDRTILLETDYEYRCGFDVVLRVTHEMTRTDDFAETIGLNE
ncbi:hypothetical protein M3689_05600 [Alkalihalophilus marmarensis]|uniref:phage neck terminator protein n=1 Tax=Alkalihalophilus marmarensis TaxID=521377 RepID=UPI00203C0662|nr:hypothetical protein [Alkalihalophilus marmarensis]MCM3488781.1 hypothetical protein [Alkalihalophilus marmarensis]